MIEREIYYYNINIKHLSEKVITARIAIDIRWKGCRSKTA
jgi:hypothetical protein